MANQLQSNRTMQDLRKIFLLGGRKLLGLPDLEIEPGATLTSTKEQLFLDPFVVYFNQQTGNDANPGTAASPKETYTAAAALVDGVNIKVVESQTSDEIVETSIDVPLQSSIGQNPLVRSDTLSWLQRTSIGGDDFNGIATDGVSTVIATRGTGYSISTDGGATWTDGVVIPGNTGECFGILYDGSKFIISAGTPNITSGTPPNVGSCSFWSSSDLGSTWTQGTLDNEFGCARTIAYDGATYIADSGGSTYVDGPDSIWRYYTSTNGLNWIARDEVFSGGSTDIQYKFAAIDFPTFGKVFMGIPKNSGDNIYYSTNPAGIIWTDSSSGNGAQLNGINVVNGILWAVGSDYAVTITDGVSLTFDDYGFSGTPVMNDVVYQPNTARYYAFGNANALQYTDDITAGPPTFTTATGPDTDTVAVTIIGETIIAATNDGANTEIHTSRFQIDATEPMCGVRVENVFVSELGGLLQCTVINDDSVAVGGTICRKNLFEIESDSFIVDFGPSDGPVRDNLFNARWSGSYTSDGADVIITNNTFLKDIALTNANSTGLEFIADNIIEAKFDFSNAAASPLPEFKNCNIRAAFTNATADSDSSNVDPLFIDQFRLQRKTGYGQETYPFDSFLIVRSKYSVTSQGNPRDLGAWSYDDSKVELGFTRAFEIQKVKAQSMPFTKLNKAYLHEGLSGAFDLFNDVDRRGERIKLTWDKGMFEQESDFIEFMERQEDTTLYVSIDPNIKQIVPSVTVDGAQSEGSPVLNIQPLNVFASTRIKIDDTVYYTVYTMDAANLISNINVTQLVLSEPLKRDVADAEVFNANFPEYEGQYLMVPQAEGTFNRSVEWVDTYIKGRSMTLVRKEPTL